MVGRAAAAAATGIASICGAAALWAMSAGGADVIVGPVWTPQLVSAGLLVGDLLLAVSVPRALAGDAVRDPTSWPQLVRDGLAALWLLGCGTTAVLVVLACLIRASFDRIEGLPGPGGRYLRVEQVDGFRPADTRVGVRHGLVVIWDGFARG